MAKAKKDIAGKAAPLPAQAMTVEQWTISRPKPYPGNPRCNDAAVKAVAASLKEFGWRQPIVVDEAGFIIVGHTRLRAAVSLGLVEVPVHVARGLTPEQVRAYRIADNATGEIAQWDDAFLEIELKDLKAADFDLTLLGFEEEELGRRMGRTPESGLTNPDDVPEVPKDAVTKRGDLWRMGEQRLLCGDSTKAEDVARLMGGERADLCFTSPPYGQQRDYTPAGKVSDWDALMQGVFGNLPMAENGQVIVNLGLIHRENEWLPYWDAWIEWMRKQGWKRFGWYVWDQGFGLPGNWNGRFGPSHEFLFHFNKSPIEPVKWVDKKPENIKPRNAGESTMRGPDGKTKAFSNPSASGQPTKIPDSVVKVTRQVGSDGHPAQFPVALPSFFMKSWPGSIYEPFSGSGSTIIAAEECGRICFGMEIETRYCDIAVTRWEKFTGRKATLEGAA